MEISVIQVNLGNTEACHDALLTVSQRANTVWICQPERIPFNIGISIDASVQSNGVTLNILQSIRFTYRSVLALGPGLSAPRYGVRNEHQINELDGEVGV
jgi:hypothetical protein